MYKALYKCCVLLLFYYYYHPVSLSQKLQYILKLVSGPTLQSRVVFHKAARKLRATLRMTGEPFIRAQSSPVNVSFVSFTTRKDHQSFLTYEQLYETHPPLPDVAYVLHVCSFEADL